MHHGIATAIASDFLNRRRNRKEFPQRGANFAIFLIAKCIATATVSFPQRNRNLFPRKNRCVQFDRVNESQTLTANHRREMVHLGLKVGRPLATPLIMLGGHEHQEPLTILTEMVAILINSVQTTVVAVIITVLPCKP